MSKFTYDCPNCSTEMNGSFGDDITCSGCGKQFETDFEYVNDGISSWITKEIENDMIKIKLTPEQIEFLEIGNAFHCHDGSFYQQNLFYKKLDEDGNYECVKLNDLPDAIKGMTSPFANLANHLGLYPVTDKFWQNEHQDMFIEGEFGFERVKTLTT